MLDTLYETLLPVMDGFVVNLGNWSRAPNVDTVHIHQGKSEPGHNRQRGQILIVDLFTRELTETPILTGWNRHAALQQTIESHAEHALSAMPSVIHTTVRGWDPDGGAFHPTIGSRLILDVLHWQVHVDPASSVTGCQSQAIPKPFPPRVNIHFEGDRDAL